MLRAGLIGYPSTGKTTLFRLMTSAREGTRPGHHGKLEANVGISRVPDARLDELRWLLEELRVSLFAQELRTPTPVSVKRLQKALDALRT